VKISSCGEESVRSDEEENVSDNSSMQHGIWANSGAERPRFPFTGKPGKNVDVEDPSNPPKQGIHQKPDNKSCFPRKKILETPIFLDLFSSTQEMSYLNEKVTAPV
jgi:hypothetical protein